MLPKESKSSILYFVKYQSYVIWGEADTALLPCLLEGLDHYIDDLTIRTVGG